MSEHMPLSRKQIDAIFQEATHQAEYTVKLYRVVFPNWDDIKFIDGYPLISYATSRYIMSRAMDFDSKHHGGVTLGGMWLNKGFASTPGPKTPDPYRYVPPNERPVFVDTMPDWVADISQCKLEMKKQGVTS